eukprot:SAG11_NODE_1340_length_5165_cov_3.807146_5_plen_94_part_01
MPIKVEANEYADVSLVRKNMCEGCGSKQATYALAGEKRQRWCAACGKAHGAVDVANKMCEDCGSKWASYGLAGEKRKRWCAACRKAHGAVDVAN